MKAVEITTSLLEILNPSLWLRRKLGKAPPNRQSPSLSYLRNHHMAIEEPFGDLFSITMRHNLLLNIFPYAGNNWSSDGDVGNEMAVHDIDVKPISSMLLDDSGALVGQVSEIRGEN